LGRTSDDPLHRAVLFSPASMQKLKELTDVASWVDWAKSQVDEAVEHARSLSEQEFKRVPSDAGNLPKWELTFRLHTPTHSIRPKALKWWNDGVERVKFYPVNGRKHELLMKAVLPDGVTGDKLFLSGKALGDHILLALNIASVGYFYWYLPPHLETYVELAFDLERKAQLNLRRPQALFPDLGRRRVLDDGRLKDAVVVIGLLYGIENRHEAQAFEHYLMALKLIARTDVHLDISGQAYGEFYLCLSNAVEVYGPADARPLPERLREVLAAQVQGFDEAPQFVEWGEEFRVTAKGPKGITLEKVMMIKVLTDLYLIRALKRIARIRWKEAEAQGPASRG
jgi:hypothetical protein